MKVMKLLIRLTPGGVREQLRDVCERLREAEEGSMGLTGSCPSAR